MSQQITDLIKAAMEGAAKARSCTSYCDKIAATLFDALKARDPDGIIGEVGRIKWDLDQEGSHMVSTKKTIELADRNGNRYRVTVEDLRDLKKAAR